MKDRYFGQIVKRVYYRVQEMVVADTIQMTTPRACFCASDEKIKLFGEVVNTASHLLFCEKDSIDNITEYERDQASLFLERIINAGLFDMIISKKQFYKNVSEIKNVLFDYLYDRRVQIATDESATQKDKHTMLAEMSIDVEMYCICDSILEHREEYHPDEIIALMKRAITALNNGDPFFQSLLCLK